MLPELEARGYTDALAALGTLQRKHALVLGASRRPAPLEQVAPPGSWTGAPSECARECCMLRAGEGKALSLLSPAQRWTAEPTAAALGALLMLMLLPLLLLRLAHRRVGRGGRSAARGQVPSQVYATGAGRWHAGRAVL